MSLRRFFAPPVAFKKDLGRVTLTRDEVRHLRDVLRLNAGDEVLVFDGQGEEYRCAIRNLMRDSAELEIIENIDSSRFESPLGISLGVALLKGEKFDLVVQKVTELGVTIVHPMMTKFADVRLQDPAEAEKRIGRWRRIAIEAAKQSGRSLVPEITTPIALEDMLREGGGIRLMFAERNGLSLSSIKPSMIEVHSVTALVASEGGWSQEEITLAQDLGWNVVTLGNRIMRAETAAIAITALLQHLFGDLK